MDAPLTCPVCRAGNAAGPDCRRCKADLSLLWRLEAARSRRMSEARAAASAGRWAAAARLLDAAHALRNGPDTARLCAAVALHRRNAATEGIQPAPGPGDRRRPGSATAEPAAG